MIKINKYIVKPLSSKNENFFLILAFILLILTAGIFLKLRHKPHYSQELQENEVSSFNDLNNIELSIYSDIKNSFLDISILKNENIKFPSIDILEQEEIPPYYKDKSWEEKGKIEWNIFEHDQKIYYLGLSSSSDIGSFLILFNEEEIEKSDIFFTHKIFKTDDILKNFTVYENEFKKIVPYTGEDERKKFKGE